MALLKTFKISTRIYLMVAVQLTLMVVVGCVALMQMQKIGNELVAIAEQDIPITTDLNHITEHQLEQAVLFERAMAAGLAVELGFQDQQALRDLQRKFNDLAGKVEQEFIDIEHRVEQAIGRSHSAEAATEFGKLLELLKQIDKEHSTYDKAAAEVLELALAGKIEEAYQKSHEVSALEDSIDQALISTLEQVQAFTLNAALQAEQDERAGQKLILISFAISLVLSVALPMVISRAITVPVTNMRNRLQEIAEGDGDLRVRLEDSAHDETGDAARAFNRLLVKLSEIVKTINRTSKDLCQQSETTVGVMNETRDSVEKQQQETELVATAIEEMAATVADVAESTEKAANLGEIVHEKVVQGMNLAVESQGINQQLTDEIGNASQVILSLAKETDNIGIVLNDIRGIADQTNLLALNASIEASRAGDAGRGFAVVADEVRDLARRTQTSTQGIQNLLERFQQEAANAVKVMESGQENAAVCLDKATTTADALAEVTKVSDEISALITQIASAAEEQASVANEINQNLVRITEVADQTSDGARLTSEASQGVARELTKLDSYVGQLKV